MVTFMGDDQVFLVLRDGVVERGGVVVLVGGDEVVLVQLDRHPHPGRHNLPEQLHVAENPLVAYRSYSEVTLQNERKSKHVIFGQW